MSPFTHKHAHARLNKVGRLILTMKHHCQNTQKEKLFRMVKLYTFPQHDRASASVNSMVLVVRAPAEPPSPSPSAATSHNNPAVVSLAVSFSHATTCETSITTRAKVSSSNSLLTRRSPFPSFAHSGTRRNSTSRAGKSHKLQCGTGSLF